MSRGKWYNRDMGLLKSKEEILAEKRFNVFGEEIVEGAKPPVYDDHGKINSRAFALLGYLEMFSDELDKIKANEPFPNLSIDVVRKKVTDLMESAKGLYRERIPFLVEEIADLRDVAFKLHEAKPNLQSTSNMETLVNMVDMSQNLHASSSFIYEGLRHRLNNNGDSTIGKEAFSKADQKIKNAKKAALLIASTLNAFGGLSLDDGGSIDGAVNDALRSNVPGVTSVFKPRKPEDLKDSQEMDTM